MRKYQKTKDKMTIDRLAKITARGFLEMDKRFSKVDKRFDELDFRTDKKLDNMDKRLNNMEIKIDGLENTVKESSGKMLTIADKMSKQFDVWHSENILGTRKQREHEEKIEDHEKRILKIEKRF